MELSLSSYKEQMKMLLGPEVTSGNSVDVLVNGDEIFPAMLDAIRNAQESVHFVTFVYWSGVIAKEFADAIAKKAREGVECYVILDALGAHRMDRKLVAAMREAGARVVFYNDLTPKDLPHYLNRTHRKILVTDHKVAFNGGVGIADEWRGDARHQGEWHDIHFRVTGPAVAQIFNAFAENWNEIDETETKFDYLTPDEGDYPVRPIPGQLPYTATVGNLDVQSFHSSPRDGHFEAYELYKSALESVRNTLHIENAYFVPNEEMLDLLFSAKARGVDIKVILPADNNDSWFARTRSRAIWGEILRADIEIYRHTPSMSHSKFMIVDGQWVTAGSVNFDTVSFKINEESNLNFFGLEFSRVMKKIFDYDLSRSSRVTLREWEDRSFFKKAEEAASKLIPIPV